MNTLHRLDEFHAQLVYYSADLNEPCSCGKAKGHVGWIVCVMQRPPVPSNKPKP